MKTVKFEKFRKVLRGKGFVIALALSITAVGASTYLAYNQAISKIGGLGEETDSGEQIIGFGIEDGRAVDKAKNDVPIDNNNDSIFGVSETPQETEAIEEAIADSVAEEANNFIEPKAPMIMPVEGEILTAFSNNELVKSKTLGVWKTHDGIDISAEAGTPVKSMTNGTVSEVFSDALWGICVVVDHGDGVVGCYFGLDKNVPVIVGQTLSTGDVIGAVGNTAEIEIAEETHLHFAVKKNSEWIDPAAYIVS